jgi:hypothetical protein
MKKKIIVYALLVTSCLLKAEISPYIITFFIRPLPGQEAPPSKTKKLEQKIANPEKIIKTLIKKELATSYLSSGIYASYAGYITRSDINGQIMFPRKAAQPKLHLLITQEIKAVAESPMKRKIILGFVLDPKAARQYYLYQRTQDTQKETASWSITEESIAEGKKIPYDTIIVFANPKHIRVPLGTHGTPPGENLILPTMYSAEQLTHTANALRFLKIRHFFTPVKIVYNFKPEEYQERVAQ